MPNLGLDEYSPGVLAFLAATAFVAALARGFSGFGGALIFVPLASAAIGPRAAAPLLLIIDAVAAAGLIPNAWRHGGRREVATMALGAAAGVPLGTFVLARMDSTLLRWMIVAAVVLLLALLMSGWRCRGAPSPPLTLGVGALSGLFSGAAQVGGPPVVAYWLGGAGSAATVRANLVLYFAVVTVFAAVSYWAEGLLTAPVLGLALVTGPIYGLGLYCGSRLFGRASERAFRRICYALIAAAAVLGLPLFDGVMR
jgi:uncharacterized membrane protein YfcA